MRASRPPHLARRDRVRLARHGTGSALYRTACAAAALLALALPGCSSLGGGEAPPQTGLIVYHEHAHPPSKLKPRGSPAWSQIFTTGDEELASKGALRTQTGVVMLEESPRVETDSKSRKVAEQVLARARQDSTVIVTTEKFADLWERLRGAGLFDLPPYRGEQPPSGRSYFLLEAGGRKHIFVRPRGRPADGELSAAELIKRWWTAQAAMVGFINEQ